MSGTHGFIPILSDSELKEAIVFAEYSPERQVRGHLLRVIASHQRARAVLKAIREVLGEPPEADDMQLAARISQRIVELNNKCTKAIDAAQRWLAQLKEAQEIGRAVTPEAAGGEELQAQVHEEFQRLMQIQEEEREGHVA